MRLETMPENHTKNYAMKGEMLSAFIDAEQLESETSHIVDILLKDSDYKEQYIRSQCVNEYLHDDNRPDFLDSQLRTNISLALNDLPSHFVEEAVSLEKAYTEDLRKTSLFQTLQNSIFSLYEHKLVAGLSVAASVMMVTLFSLQNMATDSNEMLASNDSRLEQKTVSDAMLLERSSEPLKPSLIQRNANLPLSLASTNSSVYTPADTGSTYQWIEADPILSQQVRDYVKEHEKYRPAYGLQPQIRTATYQPQ
jgi:negative regulator of sigma E activity